MEHEPDMTVITAEIAKILKKGDFIAANEAQRLVNLMRRKHPEAHAAFLEQNAHMLYRRVLCDAAAAGRRVRSLTTQNGETRNDAENPAPPERMWHWVIDADNTWRQWKDMRPADWGYVGEQYEQEEATAGERKTAAYGVRDALQAALGDEGRTGDWIDPEAFRMDWGALLSS